MNNLEKLKEIEHILHEALCFDADVNELIEPIKKDLEILEIFKKGKLVGTNLVLSLADLYLDGDDEKSEYFAIKDWIKRATGDSLVKSINKYKKEYGTYALDDLLVQSAELENKFKNLD